MTNEEAYRAAFDIRAPRGSVEAAMARAESRRTPRRGAVIALVAAALALMGAAAIPAANSLLTSLNIIHTDRVFSASFGDVESPVSCVDGRLWFTYNGESVEITDLVDEETPYIYSVENPQMGIVENLIVGGTPERFGWAEVWIDGGNVCIVASAGDQYTAGGKQSTLMELTPEQFRDEELWRNSSAGEIGQWLINGVAALKLEQYLT